MYVCKRCKNTNKSESESEQEQSVCMLAQVKLMSRIESDYVIR